MKLVKTTLRLNSELKKSAEREAIEKDTTLQAVVNSALESHLEKASGKKEAHSLGSVDPEIQQLTKKLIEHYRPALEELAHK